MVIEHITRPTSKINFVTVPLASDWQLPMFRSMIFKCHCMHAYVFLIYVHACIHSIFMYVAGFCTNNTIAHTYVST